MMNVGIFASFRKTRSKRLVLYLIFLFVLVPILSESNEFVTESIPIDIDEEHLIKEDFEGKTNYSIINNEFNIYYEDIIIKDDLAIINNKYSVIIYNITNPVDPYILSESTRYENRILKMQVENDILYIGYHFSLSSFLMTKIQAFNISDPTKLESIGCFLYYNFHDFVIQDEYGYISTNNDKMVIFSVQDPTNMTIVGELNGFTSAFYKILVHDNCSILYANEWNNPNEYVLFVDITNKENPVIAYHGIQYYQIVEALTYNDTLYLLSTNSLFSVDISNIYSPQFLASYYIANGRALYINDGYAYLEDFTRLRIYDIRDPNDFDFITYHFLDNLNTTDVSSIDFYGNYSFFACGLEGISVFNITDYIIFTKLYQSGFGEGKEVYYDDDLCFILESHKLNVFNATNLSHMTLLDSFELDYTYDMQFEDNRAYIFTDLQITILNISDPTNLTKIGEINAFNRNAMRVKNGLIALCGASISLYNVTDPETITLLDQESLPSAFCNAIEMINETIILSEYGKEFYFYNYSNPNDIQYIDSVYIAEYSSAERTFLYENYLFIISYYSEEILVLNLTSIQFADYFYIDGHLNGYNDIHIEDDLMYLASWDEAFTVYNISDLNNLTLQSEIDNLSKQKLDMSYRLFVKNSTVFILNNEGVLQILGVDSDNDYLANYLEEEIYLTTTGLRDSDSDLIIDGFEVYYGLDPLNISDAGDDFDQDNLTNLEEFQYLSNPILRDSDFDCLYDEDEITIYNTNLTSPDTDNDLIIDGYEIFVSLTDPLGNDTDQDGLLDGEEVLFYSTDPLDNDTDDDSMSDFYEVTYTLNPLDPSDKYLDLDMDGLLNFEEYMYNTRPDSADSDFDYYSDFEEIEAGTDPLDPFDHPDYTRTFTTSFVGYDVILILISSISVLSMFTIIIRFRKRRSVRID